MELKDLQELNEWCKSNYHPDGWRPIPMKRDPETNMTMMEHLKRHADNMEKHKVPYDMRQFLVDWDNFFYMVSAAKSKSDPDLSVRFTDKEIILRAFEVRVVPGLAGPTEIPEQPIP